MRSRGDFVPLWEGKMFSILDHRTADITINPEAAAQAGKAELDAAAHSDRAPLRLGTGFGRGP